MPDVKPNSIFSFRSLIDLDNERFLFRAESDPAGMEIRAFIFPKAPQKFMTPEALALTLREAGVVHGLDLNAIRSSCFAANAGVEQKGVILAKARPPVHGHDEYIKYFVNPNSDRRRLEAFESKRLEGEAMRLIENVLKGEEIGRLESPTGGVPGMTVFGIPIPARDGAPLKSRPAAGVGVFWDDEARSYAALSSGRVILEKDELSVSEKYRLLSDVNRKTGNIDFVGDLEISGSVQDGFKAKARSMKIRGNVGECRLESEGDISFGSMNGNYAGSIVCGGDLFVDSMTCCDADVKGNLHAKVSLSRCSVKCGGAILAQTARVESGVYAAFKGIDLLSAGSDRNSRTTLRSGICPFTEHLLRRERRDLSRKERKLERMRRMMEPYARDPVRIESLRGDGLRSFKTLSEEIKKISQEISELVVKIRDLEDYKAKNGNPYINIRGVVLHGVVAIIGKARQELDLTTRAPVTIGEEYGGRNLSFNAFRPQAIEAKALRKQEEEPPKASKSMP